MEEHISCKNHINIEENKVSKNLGLLYKAKNDLNQKAMTSFYYSYLHIYLTYKNIACCSVSMLKLKQLASKERQAKKAILFEFTQTTSKSIGIMCKVGILNLNKTNNYKYLNFMVRVIHHKYTTGFGYRSFKEPKLGLRLIK